MPLLSTFRCPLQLGIMTTTAAGLEQILPWLYYHRTLGFEMFFLFAEGHVTLPENAAVLATIPVSALGRTGARMGSLVREGGIGEDLGNIGG